MGMGLLILAMSLNGSFSAFIDVRSFLIVILAPILLSFGYLNRQNILLALRASVLRKKCTTNERRVYIETLQLMRNLFCAAGALGFIIGLVMMLRNLEDPSRIGPAMAIALLTVFYGLFVGELIIAPLSHRLAIDATHSGHPTDTPADAPPPPSDSRAAIMACMAVLANLGIFGLLLSILE